MTLGEHQPIPGLRQRREENALRVTAAIGAALLTPLSAVYAQQQTTNQTNQSNRTYQPPRMPAIPPGPPVRGTAIITPPPVTRVVVPGATTSASGFGPGAIPMPTVGAIPNPTISPRVLAPNAFPQQYDRDRYYNRYHHYRTPPAVTVINPSPYYPQLYYPYYAGVNGVGMNTVLVPNGIGGVTTINVFGGYYSTYVPQQTVIAPFGTLYGCPGYIRSSYVLTTPYAYSSGIETAPLTTVTAPAPATGETAQTRSLRFTLSDLERFWEEDNVRALRTHLDPDDTVAVYRGEKFAYSLRRPDLLALFEDAQNRTETISFRFTDVQRRDDGLVNAYARHTYQLAGKGGNAKVQEATVRCTLLYRDGIWYLSALSVAPDTVAR